MDQKERSNRSKAIKILLFWSIWIFLVLLSKKIVSSPGGDLSFAFKAISTFFAAVLLTGTMLHFLSGTIIRFVIIFTFISALILAIT